MKDTLDPITIYEKTLENQIEVTEAIEYLISIIETSNNTNKRLESLEILLKIKHFSQNIFNTLENCIISDEHEGIRIACARIIIENYLLTGEECLKWVLLNDKSSKLLKVLGDMLGALEDIQKKDLYPVFLQRIDRIAEEFEIDSEEVLFLLDLDFNLKKFSFIEWNSNCKLFYDEITIFQVKNQHIIELSISLRNAVPSSIYLLKNLKNLNLSCNNLTNLPNTLSELSNLESLDLSWNDFTEIPEVVSKLNTIKKLNFQNNLSQ
ncbi:MAG: hypothetical protein ACFE9R_12470 [Candidatus Hermodarchaeota archaeon]